MNSIVNFKKARGRGGGARRGRLHVGYRKRDWCLVWYEPLVEMQGDDNGEFVAVDPDEDGAVPLALFQVSSGPHRGREPMEGEVVWLPHFALPIEESSNRKEQMRLQMQFLYDAWRYMNEEDDDALEGMELELENPKHRRWQSWFDEAKKLKAKSRRARNKRAKEQATTNDLTAATEEIEIIEDTSEDGDSTYDSTEEMYVPGLSRTKRKAGQGGKSGRSSKRSKASSSNGNGGRFMGSPSMGSGGLGSRDDDDNLGPSLNRLGANSFSPSSSSGKRLPETQQWRSDEESRQMNGDLDDDEAINSAIRASMAPEGDDPATNVDTQAD